MRKFITFLIFSCLPLLCVAQGVITRPTKPSKPTAPVSRPAKSRKPSGPAKPTVPNLSVSSPDAYISGHGYVDLGLSVKWATCNVGASSPSDYGDYFAWGETSTKSEYTTENSKTYGKTMGDIAGNSSYDAVRANWGGSWRLPTMKELEELENKCIWTWITENGHSGYCVQGPNGKSIFLPAAGWSYGKLPIYAGEYGSYWSSTRHGGNDGACALFFYSGYRIVYWYNRDCGDSVRPVSE